MLMICPINNKLYIVGAHTQSTKQYKTYPIMAINMKMAKKLTTFVVLGLTISSAQALETSPPKAISEASFDWGTFSVTTSAAPNSSEPAPTIQWIYQDTYATSNSQKNKTIGWDTSLEIAENGISSWSRINVGTVHSYAKDINVSADSKAWSSSYRVGGFKVTGKGIVTFSANYALSSVLSPGSELPSYADSAALITIKDANDIELVSQKDSVDLNNSNANANSNGITKANKFIVSLNVQDGQQYKFSADIHAKAGLSNVLGSTNPQQAVVLGNWCASATEDCDGAFRIDLATGKRTIISKYTKADEDKLFDAPTLAATIDRGGKWWEKVAIGVSGDIFVYSDNRYDLKTGNTNKGIYRISPVDGTRQLFSNLTAPNATVTVNSTPVNLLATSTNQLLMNNAGKVTALNLSSSQLSVLTDSITTNQGPAFSVLLGTDPYGDLFGLAVSGLVQIDSNTGLRKPFANYGIDPAKSLALIDSSGNIISVENGILSKYNNVGSTHLISDLNDQSQGVPVSNAIALNQTEDGRFLLLDGGNGSVLGKLVAIDPSTGTRTLVSDFQNQDNGPLLYDARAIAIGSMPTAVKTEDAGISGNKPVLTQTESVDSIQFGQEFSYLVSYSNYAPEVSNKVKLVDTLPKRVKFVSAEVIRGNGACTGKARVVCNFGSVTSGARVVAKITVLKNKAGSITNSAVVTYNMKQTGAKRVKSFKLVSKKFTLAK